MILAGTEGHARLGRLVNGLEAKEFAENDEAVQDAGVVQLDDHPSIRSLVDDDYEIITF